MQLLRPTQPGHGPKHYMTWTASLNSSPKKPSKLPSRMHSWWQSQLHTVTAAPAKALGRGNITSKGCSKHHHSHWWHHKAHSMNNTSMASNSKQHHHTHNVAWSWGSSMEQHTKGTHRTHRSQGHHHRLTQSTGHYKAKHMAVVHSKCHLVGSREQYNLLALCGSLCRWGAHKQLLGSTSATTG